ncbi:MAG: RluA family pseudouridine synthase [Gammaproteobacteria bacterium]|nr:RluA family pseudouridine synthase [Gammaproteobacteria bacterium]
MTNARSGPAAARESRSTVATQRIDAADAGQRIDNFLLRHFKSVPRSRVYRLLRKGEVRVNGKRIDADYRLEAGDTVRLPPVRIEHEAGPGRPSASLQALIERAVIHEDRHLLVIDKPSGVAVHGGSGMSFGVIETLRAARPDEPLELVHRLDRDTSGCLLVARDRPTLVALHALIRDGGMHKTYLALLAGSWQLGKKRIDAPLATDARERGERHVHVAAAGKASVSLFKPVQFFGSLATLMEVEIPTGRTHQIRVHARHAGHPVLGDDKYGDRERNAAMREFGLDRIFLHAHSVAFDWPGTGVPFHASAPLPPDLAAVIDQLSRVRSGKRRGPRAQGKRAQGKG